jgi:hypothetical protein
MEPDLAAIGSQQPLKAVLRIGARKDIRMKSALLIVEGQ